MICSRTSDLLNTYLHALVSGQPAQEPVATKNGDIYEKRLIIKHIEAHGVDPITNEALTAEDLVVLRVSNPNGVKPRQVSQSSIPGLLQVCSPFRSFLTVARLFKMSGMLWCWKRLLWRSNWRQPGKSFPMLCIKAMLLAEWLLAWSRKGMQQGRSLSNWDKL